MMSGFVDSSSESPPRIGSHSPITLDVSAVTCASRQRALQFAIEGVAAGEGDSMAVSQRLLDAGTDAVGGHSEATSKVVQNASDQSNLSMDSVTKTLQLAVDEGKTASNEPLLETGAAATDIDIREAVAERHLDVLLPILKSCASDGTVLSCHSGSALQLAAKGGDLAVVDLLLTSGADANAPANGDYGGTAVQIAVQGGYLAVTKRLIDAGADVNAPPCRDYYDTAFQAAVRAGNTVMLELLLSAGAVVDTAEIGDYGCQSTVLSVAAEKNKPELVARLLSLIPSDEARRIAPAALRQAVAKHHIHIVRQLLQLHPDVNCHQSWSSYANEFGGTLLQVAVSNGDLAILEMLIAAKADVNLNPSEGWRNTALQSASEQGSLDAVQLLLAAGAELDVAGSTAPPLLLAIQNGHIQVFERLLAAGADIHATAYRGQTMLQAAENSGNAEIQERLRDALHARAPPVSLDHYTLGRGVGSLCQTCRAAGLFDLFSGKTDIGFDPSTLHPSLIALRASAVARCPFCCFLWKVLGIASISLPQPSPVTLYLNKPGSVTCEVNEPFPDEENFEKLQADFDIAVEPFRKYRIPIAEDTASPGTYKQIKTWLDTCNNEHPKCRVPLKKQSLPTRLVRLDSSTCSALSNAVDTNLQPVLVSTVDMEVSKTRYMALSYRWPEDFPNEAKSTRQTVLKNMRGLNISKLPRSFNDVFHVAAQMGINYVWIDSLCIVQDDTEDWNREAARMSQIYRNAYFTLAIAVRSAAAPHQGLFRRGDPAKIHSESFSCPLEDGTSQEVVVMKKQRERYEESPLVSRGWYFQEREISQRMVHYTENQVLWECRTMRASESLPNGDAMQMPGLLKSSLSQWPRRMLDKHLSGDDVSYAWLQAVEDYSDRQLTRDIDKLPALAGLAAAVRSYKPATCRYLAGLWEDNFLSSMAWTPGSSHIQTFTTNERYSDYIAPTWSWASVAGPVRFLISPLKKPNSASSEHSSKSSSSTKCDRTIAKYAMQVLDIHVQTSTNDPFGAVKHAVLKCTAGLLSAWLAPPSDPDDARGKRFALCTRGGRAFGEMLFDTTQEAQYHGQDEKNVFCICLGVLALGGNNAGLVILPTGNRENEFRRVGIALNIASYKLPTAEIKEIMVI